MPEPSGMKSSHSAPADSAIAQIVQMNPRRVTVTLTLPISVPGGMARPTVTLEWGREDTNMPLSDLLNRIESYVAKFGLQ